MGHNLTSFSIKEFEGTICKQNFRILSFTFIELFVTLQT